MAVGQTLSLLHVIKGKGSATRDYIAILASLKEVRSRHMAVLYHTGLIHENNFSPPSLLMASAMFSAILYQTRLIQESNSSPSSLFIDSTMYSAILYYTGLLHYRSVF